MPMLGSSQHGCGQCCAGLCRRARAVQCAPAVRAELPGPESIEAANARARNHCGAAMPAAALGKTLACLVGEGGQAVGCVPLLRRPRDHAQEVLRFARDLMKRAIRMPEVQAGQLAPLCRGAKRVHDALLPGHRPYAAPAFQPCVIVCRGALREPMQEHGPVADPGRLAKVR